MTEILINQSVAILCDGNNIERSIHEMSKSTKAMINFDELIPKLLNGRGLNRLIYFREGKSISKKFAERLHENYYGSVIPCHKSADIPLSIDLVTHLRAEGVRVEIAAVRPNTANILIDESDYYHEIISDDWFIYKASKRPAYTKKK